MQIFKIRVVKWNEHNKSAKNTYKKTMVSHTIVTDAKLLSLPVGCRWLFVCLILRCGENGNDTVTLTERQVNDILSTRIGAENALSLLQSLQLVTFEKTALIKERKKELKERKKEENSRREQQLPLEPENASRQDKPAPVNASHLIAFYCDTWKVRYKAEKSPPMLPHHSKNLKTLMEQVGLERAKRLVEAYLSMPDSWFVTKRHDIPTLMGNLNAVTQFADSGKMFTRRQINQLDVSATNQQTLDALDKGEI